MSPKSAITNLLSSGPISALFRGYFASKPLVLLYHGVTTQRDRHGSQNYRGKHIESAVFRSQILELKKHFTIVPLSEIEALYQGKNSTRTNLCAITFDDGYRNNATVAFPILKELNVPATFFLTGEFIDKGQPLWIDRLEYSINHAREESLNIEMPTIRSIALKTTLEKIAADSMIRTYMKSIDEESRMTMLEKIENETGASLLNALSEKSDQSVQSSQPDYAPMTWEDARVMMEAGMSFGAHTMTHPILSSETREVQEREIVQSIDLVKQNLGSCPHFAYPNGQPGDWNSDTEEILKNNGFAVAWSTYMGRVGRHDSPFALPRITLDNTDRDNRFNALISNALPFLKKLTK